MKAKRLIGVVPQRPNLDFALTAREILTFHGAYFGQSARERDRRADELLEKFKLTDRADHMVRTFSGGMMQRLSIARAMMHDPEVLFLDEPRAGLDPQTRLLLWEIIRDYNRQGKTIVLTTHYMDEADALCDRLAIIDHGKIIAQGTPAGVEVVDSRAATCCACASTACRKSCCRVARAAGRYEVRSPDDSVGRCVRRPRRSADRGRSSTPRRPRARTARRAHCGAESGNPVSAPHRKELARLNWKTFFAMLARDAHVARRNLVPMLMQNLLQPLLLDLRLRPGADDQRHDADGIQERAAARHHRDQHGDGGRAGRRHAADRRVPVHPEIEDRLLAPIENEWLAVEKMVAGMIQALVVGPGRDPGGVADHGFGVDLDLRPSAGVPRRWRCWWRCWPRPAGCCSGAASGRRRSA